MNCPKCSGTELKKKYVKYGELIDSSSFNPVDTDFVFSIEYEYYYKLKAKKEHVLVSCDCGHQWREAVPNDKLRGRAL